MNETVMTIEDADRCLPDLVDRVHARGEAVLLIKSGQPLARIVPVSRAKTTKIRSHFCAAGASSTLSLTSNLRKPLKESRREGCANEPHHQKKPPRHKARWQLVARREIAETRRTSATVKYRSFLN